MEIENNVSGEQNKEARDRYLAKLLPIIKQRGFSHVRIDDIVRYMDISKATFYKYFSSKEEVVELVVEMLVDYFKQATKQIDDDTSPCIQRFQHVFGQSLVIANYLSEAFLLDLRQVFPPLWERVKQAQQERQRHIQQFYEQGVAAGVFQPVNAVLIVLQDELILSSIIDPVFLMEHDLTLRALLYDYYLLQKYQWLVPAVHNQVDDTPVKEFIDMMARKISLGMH